jgi:cupin 2 domain-containing protein
VTRRVANLFAGLVPLESGEDFTELLRCRTVRIERISSSPFPEPTLYDQSQDEWALLLQGEALLEVAGEEVRLASGDHLFLPAHTPHRVLSVSIKPRCLWLAVHIEQEPTASVPAVDGSKLAGDDKAA